MKINAQTALKAALLIALGANMSWNFHRINSTELAATTAAPDSVPASAAANTATNGAISGDRTSVTPERLLVRAAKTSAAPSKPSLASDTDDKKICGDAYVIRYQEVQEDERTKTTVSYRKHGNSDWTEAFKLGGELTGINRSQAAKEIVERVTKLRKGDGLKCDDTGNATADDSKADEKELADDIKKCRKDRNGDEVRKDERLRCWLDRLAAADIPDKKKVTGKSDRRSRRERDEDDDDKQILARVKEITRGPLRKEIKSLLLSKDESRQEEGVEAIDEAIETIEGLGIRHGDIAKMLGELKGLKLGGEAVKKSREMEDDVRSLHDDVRLAYRQYMDNPLDYRASLDWQNAQQNRLNMTNQLNSELGNQLMAPLDTYRRLGLLSSEDYREFSSPYEEIRKTMLATWDPASIDIKNIGARSRGTVITSSVSGDPVPRNLFRLRSESPAGYRVPTNRFSLPTTAPNVLFNRSSLPDRR